MAAEVHRCQFLARDGSACEKTSNGGWVVRDVGAAAAEFYACGAHWSQVGRLTTGASAAAKPTPAEAAERRRKFAASQGWDEACGWVTEPALPSSHRAAKRKRALPKEGETQEVPVPGGPEPEEAAEPEVAEAAERTRADEAVAACGELTSKIQVRALALTPTPTLTLTPTPTPTLTLTLTLTLTSNRHWSRPPRTWAARMRPSWRQSARVPRRQWRHVAS